jgi:hypothetical protein
MTTTLDASCECALPEVTRDEFETSFENSKFNGRLGRTNQSIHHESRSWPWTLWWRHVACARPKNTSHGWRGCRPSKPQPRPPFASSDLLVAVIFAGSPLATKSHLHDSYFTLNTHPCISKNAEKARTGRGFLAKWVLCIVGSNLRRNFCLSCNALHPAREHPVYCCDTQKYSDTPAVHVVSWWFMELESIISVKARKWKSRSARRQTSLLLRQMPVKRCRKSIEGTQW